MNIEKRLKFLNTEKAKILGFARSHLRNVESARRFEFEFDKKIRKLKMDIGSQQAFHYWLWKDIREQCDDLLRKEHFQFRVFDDGTVDLLDQAFIKRPGGFIEEQVEVVRESLVGFPEKARAVLQLHYQKGLSCDEISRQINVPVNEVYQLWQHAIIFLWEGAQDGEGQGFQEKEDEDFWTLALRYLDGTASEKFVAELNSEIYVSQSRMKEYNDLRIIDGVMIAFGASDLWPGSEIVDAVKPAQVAPVAVERKKKKEKPPREKKDYPAMIRSSAVATFVSTRELLKTWFEKFKLALSPPLAQEAELSGQSGSGPENMAVVSESPRKTGQVDESPGTGKNLLEIGLEKFKAALLPPLEQTKNRLGKSTKPDQDVGILSKGDPDDGARRGVHLDDTPRTRRVRKKMDPLLKKKLLVFAGAGLGIVLLSFIVGKIGDFLSFGSGGAAKILRATDLEFSKGKTWRGRAIKEGNYDMTSGTMEFFTSDGIGVIVEAPATFSIKSPRYISVQKGRLVARVPEHLSGGVKLATNQFKVTSGGGEVGVIVDEQSSDVVVFSGEGILSEGRKRIAPGTGLRFLETGPPEALESRNEAYRYPDLIPMTSPSAYGDNVVTNQSFEIGTLSRSCKIERLYRDIPSGWTAGWQKDGAWSPPLEQHSGTVRITGPIGGLPAPVHGERYLWINHGFVGQELPDLEAGVTYDLSLQVASHRNIGPGSNQMIDNVGGNAFRFGLWSGGDWIAQTSGQLRAGQPFQEMKMEFKSPKNSNPESKLILMLTGETRIFYDNVVLRKKGGG